jgi:hypothetical protein
MLRFRNFGLAGVLLAGLIGNLGGHFCSFGISSLRDWEEE